jgi:hypothetical protein
MPEIMLSITFEHDGTSVAEKAAWRAGTARSIKLLWEGSTGKSLDVRMVGKWDNFEALGEQDGNDIVTGNFRARYNSTAAGFFTAIVQNSLAALP